jgi:hypothetical protein
MKLSEMILMFPKDKLENIITRIITRDEKLGRRVGGSGHSSYTSFIITTLGNPQKTRFKNQIVWQVTYIYTIIVETEFAYYPDNPPQEYRYQKSILLNQNGNIVKEYSKKSV